MISPKTIMYVIELLIFIYFIYSSLHTFTIDSSPNLSLTSHKSIPPDMEKKHSCNSPMLKTLLEPAPRSRSSDNLEKFSPLVGRRSQGDSPLTSSPLARRNTTDNSQTHERSITKGEPCVKDTYDNASMSDTNDDSKRGTLANVSNMSPRGSRDIDDSFASISDKDTSVLTSKDQENRKSLVKKCTDMEKASSSVKLRSTGYDLRSPINGSNTSTKSTSDSPKSPVLKSVTKSSGSVSDGKSNGALLKNKPTPPATAPKPRPWSMATDRKSGKKYYYNYFTIYINILYYRTLLPITVSYEQIREKENQNFHAA